MAAGIVQKGGRLPCPISDTGCFTDEVPDFKDMYIKVTPPFIIACIFDEQGLGSAILFASNVPCTKNVHYNHLYSDWETGRKI